VDAPISDTIIDQGLYAVRVMWDNGVAHRDLKPANLLVRGDNLFVIDCGFAEMRPSPWRQAVDLANMMLSLALKSTSQRVYDRAVELFSPDDIAEAFAATAGVTIPSQLRELLQQDERPLIDEFRALAPARPPIRVQHWSPRRVALIATTTIAAIALVWGALSAFVWQDRGRIDTPFCSSRAELYLVAQSVESARNVPCARSLPIGWRVTLSRADHHGSRMRFAGRDRTVTLAFASTCPSRRENRTVEHLDVPGEDAPLTQVTSAAPRAEYAAALDGACATVTVESTDASRRSASAVTDDLERLVQWVPRVFLDAALEASTRGRAHHV
jgi:hypothetical protein